MLNLQTNGATDRQTDDRRKPYWRSLLCRTLDTYKWRESFIVFFQRGMQWTHFQLLFFLKGLKKNQIFILTFLEWKKLRLVEENINKHRIFKKRMNYQYRGDNKELGRENKKKGEIITKSEIKGKFKNKYWQKKNWGHITKRI